MAVDPAPATTSTVTSGPELGDRTQRRARARDVGRAELGEQDVEREDDEHGQRNRDRHGWQQRDPHDEPALQNASRHCNGRRNNALPVSTHIRAKPPTTASAGDA